MNHDAHHVLWITIFLCVLLCAKQGLQKSVTQTEDPYSGTYSSRDEPEYFPVDPSLSNETESTDKLSNETQTDGTASTENTSATYTTDDKQNNSSFSAPENPSSKGNDSSDENSLDTSSKEPKEEELTPRKGSKVELTTPSSVPDSSSLAISQVNVSSVGSTWIAIRFEKPETHFSSINYTIYVRAEKANCICHLTEANNSNLTLNVNISRDDKCCFKMKKFKKYEIAVSASHGDVFGENYTIPVTIIPPVHLSSWTIEEAVLRLKWNDSDYHQLAKPTWTIQFRNDETNTVYAFNIPEECKPGNMTFRRNSEGRWSCSVDQEHNGYELPIQPCVSYSITVHPVFQGLKQEILTIWHEVGPLYHEVPDQIEHATLEEIDGNIRISWQKPASSQCLERFSVNQNGVEEEYVEEDGEFQTEFRTDSCTTYNIAITSIGKIGNRSYLTDFTSESIGWPEIEIVSSEEKESCWNMEWKFKSSDFQDWQCLKPLELFYKLSTNNDWSLTPGSIETKPGQQTTVTSTCLPSGKYDYKLKLSLTDRAETKYGLEGSFEISDPSATATAALVSIMVVLIIIVIAVGLYVAKPSVYHRLAEYVCPFDESKRSNNGVMMQRMPRKRSHPIRVRDVPSTTRRLCSEANKELENEYEDLRLISDSRLAPRNEANKPVNKLKNRYANVLPYDETRVVLNLQPDEPDSDYINASYIVGFNGPKEYIASQGPKDNTLVDWWRMIWEQNSRIIVMVTALEERGKTKCSRYWPEPSEDNTATYGKIVVKLTEEASFEIYTLRTFQLILDEESRTVKQFYFNNWPDFGCPENPEMLIGFIEAIRCEMANSPSIGPLVVHCSAGVGRTGTYIAVDWLMQEARSSKEIDVLSVVLRMRECRINMVQTEDQYEFVYQCISRYVTSRLQGNGVENPVVEKETLLTHLP